VQKALRVKKEPARPDDHRKWRYVSLLLLVVLTLAVYWQATGFNFQEYHDDGLYVTTNQPVLDGLTRSSILWE